MIDHLPFFSHRSLYLSALVQFPSHVEGLTHRKLSARIAPSALETIPCVNRQAPRPHRNAGIHVKPLHTCFICAVGVAQKELAREDNREHNERKKEESSVLVFLVFFFLRRLEVFAKKFTDIHMFILFCLIDIGKSDYLFCHSLVLSFFPYLSKIFVRTYL